MSLTKNITSLSPICLPFPGNRTQFGKKEGKCRVYKLAKLCLIKRNNIDIQTFKTFFSLKKTNKNSVQK